LYFLVSKRRARRRLDSRKTSGHADDRRRGQSVFLSFKSSCADNAAWSEMFDHGLPEWTLACLTENPRT
jgi:hypothetical protein